MLEIPLKNFALVLSVAVACAPEAGPDDGNDGPYAGSPSVGGAGGVGGAASGRGGVGGSSTGGSTGGSASGGSATGGASAGSANGGSAAGGASGSNATGGNATGGAGTGGAEVGGTSGAAGNGATGGDSTGGAPMGGAGAGGNSTGGASGASSTGGNASGGVMTGGGPSGGTSAGGRAGGAAGRAGGGSGDAGTGGGGSGGAPTQPDCNAAMPSGGQQRSGNGTGGQGNLAWEIWSNTGQGELTTYSAPAFIATWNNAGGYLGRLGFEWNRFGDDPVPHTQRGTIAAQIVAKKSGSAGGYSYIGMYGWTTNPCVEWYVVDDSFNTMPINPGTTTNKGERQIDGGTYIMYTRPTSGSGGTRCSGVTNWIQYYSVRKTARSCGVISLTEHFNAWQAAGMDMTGDLLEAKVLVEVGGGVGNVQLPVANVTVR
jgi:endo-1,4-beta-xylanase